jgi:predicted transcriptional regulator
MKVAARKVVKEAGKKDYHTLLKLVRQYPGIHFRELLRASGLSNGTLEYQLVLLERLDLLMANRSGGFTRYYDSNVSKTDMELIYLLKQRICREIIRLLLEGEDGTKKGSFFTFQRIVQMIGKSPSYVSVQLRRLIDHKVVSYDENSGYYIVNKEKQAIKRVLSKYKV